MSTPPRTNKWIALTALLALSAPAFAALPETLQENLSYYTDFSSDRTNFDPDAGEGRWNTTDGEKPSYVTVSGDNTALNVGTCKAYGSNQTVLPVGAKDFSIAFRARVGTQDKGLLFAFGSSTAKGGLSFMRGDAAGTLVVNSGAGYAKITYTPASAASDWAWHTYLLTSETKSGSETAVTAKLYVDGTLAGEAQIDDADNWIADAKFQWGSRFANGYSDKEARSVNGAIDALGVWTSVLTEEQIQAVVAEMAPKANPIAFTDVPEGWGTAPTTAWPIEVAVGEISLEVIPETRQTLGERAANVAQVWSSDGTPNVYGIGAESINGLTDPLERDVWLKVSGGTYTYVVGGKGNGWQNNNANTINGKLLTELSGAGTTAKAVVGALTGCGNGGGNGAAHPFTGDTLVTIADGAKVTGVVVGSMIAQHAQIQPHNGNSMVRVLTLQDETDSTFVVQGDSALKPGFIAGGSTSASVNNRDTSGSTISGNTAVEVTLKDGTGTFAPAIYGASYITDTGTASHTVKGNASVTIDAPGVTFPNTICAGGNGADSVKVEGSATLTLKGGVFSGSLIPTSNGATVGSSALNIDATGTVDLSAATLGAFDTATINLTEGTLALGEKRLPDAVLASAAKGTITVTLTDDEIGAKSATICALEGGMLPEGVTVTPDVAVGTWEVQALEGKLCCVRTDEAQNLTWTTPGEGSNWEDGLSGFAAGDNVTFGQNAADEAVTLTQDTLAGDVAVNGSYTLNGPGSLEANTIAVGTDGTLTLGKSPVVTNEVVLKILKRVGGPRQDESGSANWNNNGVALSEFRLTLGGKPIDMTDVKATATASSNNENQQADKLVDGNVNGSESKWYWDTWDTTFADGVCEITFVAPVGTFFVFDGYNLAMADQVGRNPSAWMLTIPMGGENESIVSQVDFSGNAESEVNTVKNAWLSTPLPTAHGAVPVTVQDGMTVEGTLGGFGAINGDVTFAEGAILKVPADSALTINGIATGKVTLDLSDWEEGKQIGLVLTAQQSTDGETLELVPPEGRQVISEISGTAILYYVIPAMKFPLKANLTDNTTWAGATWTDSADNPITAEILSALPPKTLEVEISTAVAATITQVPYIVKAITIKGTAPVTLAEPVRDQLSTASLTIEEGATLVTAQNVLRVLNLNAQTPAYSAINGTWELSVTASPALNAVAPALTGTGTIVKTGAGTLTLPREMTVEPTIEVREGTLKLNDGTYADIPNVVVTGSGTFSVSQWDNIINDADATITLRDGGTLALRNGNTSHASERPIRSPIVIANDGETPARINGSSSGEGCRLVGGISGSGLLIFDEVSGTNNGYTVNGVIADGEGASLAIRVTEKGDPVIFSAANTYTGGTEVQGKLQVANADALGKGDVTVADGGTLTIAGSTSLNVYGKLASAGTVTGSITLQQGASLDASAAPVAVGTLAVAEGASIPVLLPETIEVGTVLATWTSGPADASAFTLDAEGYALEVKDNTLVVKADASITTDATWINGSKNWMDGLPGYGLGTNVTFGTLPEGTTGPETVFVPDELPVAGDITISGDYALATKNLPANSLTVTETGKLTLLSQPVSGRYVTLSSADLDGASISEWTLYLNGQKVNLEGVTVTGVEGCANATDDSFDSEVMFAKLYDYVQLDAGEGKAITFDSYNVASGTDVATFPQGWYLLVGDKPDPTPSDTNTPVEILQVGLPGTEKPTLGKTYMWTTPHMPSSAGASSITIAEKVSVAGAIGGNGAVSAKEVEFLAGATIRPTGIGSVMLTAETFTGVTELALDTSLLNLPDTADPTTLIYLLTTNTETDFTFTGVPEGYRVRNIGGYFYVLTYDFAQPFSAEITGTIDWEDIVWTDSKDVELPLPILGMLQYDVPNIDFSLKAAADGATVNVPSVEPKSLIIEASDKTLTLVSASTTTFKPGKLIVNGNLATSVDTMTLGDITINKGAQLVYVIGDRTVAIPTTIRGAGLLALAGTGTVDLAETAYDGLNLTIASKLLVLAGGTTFTNGNLMLIAEGSTIDLSANTGTLTTSGFYGVGTINVKIQEGTQPETQLIAWESLGTNSEKPVTFTLENGSEDLALEERKDGLYLVEVPEEVELPALEGDESKTPVTGAVKDLILAAAGETTVTSIAATVNGEPVTDAAVLNGLIDCLATPSDVVTVTVDTEGKATVTADYAFEVTALTLGENGEVTVKAAFTSGETTVTLKEGISIQVVPVTLDGTEPGDPQALNGDIFGETGGTVTLGTGGTTLFKVVIEPPAAL